MKLNHKLELKAISLEYELDSLIAHVQQKKCSCVKPIALKSLIRARNYSRSLRDSIRAVEKTKQRTITNPGSNTGYGSDNTFLWGRGLNRIWDCTKEEKE